ncbi:hypothetical protein BAJUN_00850 [Bajunvirus bajun]|uniref:Uncharacterized protein n=1 Tax=Brevundimonas phage vB_BgoS-Bajun TaxID=2948594 RepID=A0A9E7N610_9CAUD|nr:hypothetical protein BAJUN_00850 [Brevundimonas phage vB_BgoS-Bajun]
MNIPVARIYEIEHEGITYLVTQRTITQRIARITKQVKTIDGARTYKVLDPERGAERNALTLARPVIQALIARINAGEGVVKEDRYT